MNYIHLLMNVCQRQSARAGLLKIGISSKEDIKTAMASLQMIKKETTIPKSTYLDSLCREAMMAKQRQVRSKNLEIVKWLRKVDPDVYGKPFTRISSPLETLVFPAADQTPKTKPADRKTRRVKALH
jgi:hypothetical protein